MKTSLGTWFRDIQNLRIFIFLLLLGQLTAGCNNLTMSDTQIVICSAKMLEGRASDMAQEWKSDAYLTQVFIFKLSLNSHTTPAAGYVEFLFRSHSDLQHFFIVEFSPDGGVRSREWNISFSYSDYVAIEPEDWTIDSAEAWRIALANGGKEILSNNPTAIADAFLSLERYAPPRRGSVSWYVGFPSRGAQHSTRITIDAKTGRVLHKELE